MIIKNFKNYLLLLYLLICFTSSAIAQFPFRPDTSKKKISFFAYPTISYSPETDWIFGGGLYLAFKSKTSTDSIRKINLIRPFFYYTLNDQLRIVLATENYFNHWQLISRIEFSRYPEEFFGIGNQTGGQSEFFTLTNNGVWLRAVRDIKNNLSSGIFADVRDMAVVRTVDNGILEMVDPYGTQGGFLTGIGPVMIYDSRNSNINSVSGMLFDGQLAVFIPLLGSDYRFERLTFDIRNFSSIVTSNNILAIQFKGDFIFRKDVPFYFYPGVGGESRLRGIHARRYIDRNMMMVQLEYRRNVLDLFGVTLFGGIGDVFDTFEDIQPDRIKHSMGFGIRLKNQRDENMTIRFDYGMGPGRQDGFYFGINEVF